MAPNGRGAGARPRRGPAFLALLFAAARPTPTAAIAEVLRVRDEALHVAIDDLRAAIGGLGVAIEEQRGGFALVTVPEVASDVRRGHRFPSLAGGGGTGLRREDRVP